MPSSNPTARKPWLAVVLSMLLTGLGHIYCGRIVKGLVLLFVTMLLYVHVVLNAAFVTPSTAALGLLVGSAALIICLMLYGIVDAYRIAKQSDETYTLKDYNHPLVYAVFLMIGLVDHVSLPLLMRANLLEAFVVPTASESPNILPGDRVLVNKLLFRTGVQPQRGDSVVFRNPENRSNHWVKRIIALEGDTIEVRDNDVFLNGEKLARSSATGDKAQLATGTARLEHNGERTYMIQLGSTEERQDDFAKTTVPQGCCFVLGDNRDKSRDSRMIGFIPLGDVLGPVQYVYWPAKTWSRFGKL